MSLSFYVNYTFVDPHRHIYLTSRTHIAQVDHKSKRIER